MSDNNINEEKVEQIEKEELVQNELAEEASEKPYQDVIEDARKKLYKSFMLSRRISNIVMFAVVIAIVGIMFLIISNKQVLKIIGYSLAGTLVVGMIVYYLINRKKFPNKTKEYVLLVSNALNDRAFSKPGYSEIKYDPDERMKLDDIIGDGVYEEANGVNSRNVIHGVFNGHHFLYAEAALTRPSTRKQQVPSPPPFPYSRSLLLRDPRQPQTAFQDHLRVSLHPAFRVAHSPVRHELRADPFSAQRP